MKRGMSYAAACLHRDLFLPWFSGESWDRWRILDKALFGEKLDAVELEMFKVLTGREEQPAKVREAWLGFGRRSGKDVKCASIAAYLSTIGAAQMTKGAARGETTYCMLMAVDRAQAKVCLGYIREFFRLPALKPFVRREHTDGLELNNGISIEVFTCDQRRARGRRVGLTIFDEVSHWRSDVSSNPAEDVYESILPSMANVEGALLVGISSVHMRSGLFYKKITENYGKPGPILACRAATWIMNPTLPFDGEFITATPPSAPPVSGEQRWSDLADDLAAHGGSDLVGPRFQERMQKAANLATEYEAEMPELAAAIETAAMADPRVRTEVIRFLSRQKGGRQVAPPKAEAAAPQNGPAAPSGRVAIQEAIDDLMAANPPGSHSYSSPKVQRQIAELHRKLHGDEPIVGKQNRSA